MSWVRPVPLPRPVWEGMTVAHVGRRVLSGNTQLHTAGKEIVEPTGSILEIVSGIMSEYDDV